MRSMHLSKRIEDMICELEGYSWDAVLLNESWSETHHKHTFMGAGKYDNKHKIGIILNKK